MTTCLDFSTQNGTSTGDIDKTLFKKTDDSKFTINVPFDGAFLALEIPDADGPTNECTSADSFTLAQTDPIEIQYDFSVADKLFKAPQSLFVNNA